MASQSRSSKVTCRSALLGATYSWRPLALGGEFCEPVRNGSLFRRVGLGLGLGLGYCLRFVVMYIRIQFIFIVNDNVIIVIITVKVVL